MSKKNFTFILLAIFVALLMQGCKPSLVVSPQELVFSAGETSKSFQVWNATRLSKLDFTVEPSESWISVSPGNGSSKGPGDKKTVEVNILRENITKKEDVGTIYVKSPQGGEKTVKVTVYSESAGEGEGVPMEGEGEGEEEGELPHQEEISIIGWVKDVNGNPIGYASVELLNTAHRMYSDPTGLFVFELVENGIYVLSVKKESYANYALEIEVGSVKPLTINVVLKALELAGTVDAEIGGKVEDNEGNSINIPPNSLIDENGNPVTGQVDVYITPLDLSNPKQLSAFPGGFQGISASKQGERVMIESFALADFKVMKNGKELNVNPAKADMLELVLALPDDTPLITGQNVPLWYFDEEQGLWIENGSGEVIEDGGKKYYRANIPHLSWWNCDAPLEDKNCIRGMVEDGNGYAVEGALVRAVGLSYNGVTTTYTDTSGYFCVNVKRNSNFRIEVILPGGNVPVVVQDFSGMDTPASCETGECIEITQPLIAEYNSCVQGYVRDSVGNPIVGATVRSSIGTTTITDQDGYYCLNAFVPTGETQSTVTVFVLTRPPVTVTINPEVSCANGNCAEANIEVEYPSDGSYIGYIHISQEKYKYGENEIYYGITASALFAPFSSKPIVPSELETCSVILTEYEIEEEQTEGEQWGTEPNWSGLDPGSPGYLSGVEYFTNMVRYVDKYSGWEGFTIQPWMYSLFVNETQTWNSIPLTDFTCGWSGGLDIGEFEISSMMPPELIITNPPYEEDYYYNSFNFTPDEDLLIEWIPIGAVPLGYFPYVQIILSVTAYRWNEEDGSAKVYMGLIVCYVVDDGQYLISRDLLQQLPRFEDGTYRYGFVNLVISRVFVKEAEAPLQRGGQGKIQVLSINNFRMSDYMESVPEKSK